MLRIAAAVLAAATCATAAQAQSEDLQAAGPPLTLAEALAAAGATSPNLDAVAAGVRAAEAQRQLAALRPNPSAFFEAENVAGTGSYEGLQSSETTAGLQLPVELGGKRGARIRVADAQGMRARLDAEIARADLILRVTRIYIEAVAAQRRLVTSREQVAVATEGLRVARVRVRAGRASPLEESRASVALANAEGAAERAGRSAQLASANLARLVGRPVQTLDVAWFEQIGGIGPATRVTADGTLAAAAAQADVRAAEAQLTLARSQRMPDLTVSAAARRLEQTNDVAAVFGVSMPIPLFNNGRASVGVATAERARADALRRAALLNAEQEIAGAEAEVANAATTARTATGPALAAAREAARIARIGYREGKFGQLDLLDAERTLLETRTAAIDAVATYQDAKARLERLTARASEQMDSRP
jgi:outer membrane protein, heavy metal efflux system